MDGGKPIVNPSLQRRLSMMLGGAIIATALTAAIASFYVAYGEAEEFQDDMLRQIAFLQHQSTDGRTVTGIVSANPAEAVSLSDTESRINVFVFTEARVPDWLRGNLSQGFHTLFQNDEYVRVFIVRDSAKITAVVQPIVIRNEIAFDTAMQAFFPVLLLLPVMVLLVIRIVRSGLTPVARLAAFLDEQSVDKAIQLSDRDIPEEITPFVHAINRLLGRVSVLLAQQRRFIADASHELRSPLTALSLQVQNLRHADNMKEVTLRLEPLQAGIERARNLTGQLLDLARIQATVPESSSIDMALLVRELIAEYLPVAEASGIDLGLDESGAMLLEGNPEACYLILKNGLENALNYGKPGGSVTIRLASEGNEQIIDVIDNGSGIPESDRARVFDAFYRVPGTGGQGSGLGLTIAKEAAISLGGEIMLLGGEGGVGMVYRFRVKGVHG